MHLIPFINRGFSGPHTDHLLFKEGNIYVMDNHRLALWCWLDALKENPEAFSGINLLHIDAHPDMSETALTETKINDQVLLSLSLQDYREILQDEYNIPLIRWDNYLPLFLKYFPNTIKIHNTFSATHKMGSTKTLGTDLLPHELIKFMNNYLTDKLFLNDLPWIVNLDLDYFFTAQPEKLVMFSDEYLETIAATIKHGLETKKILALTIALSPECSGSWEKAEHLLEKMFHFKIC